MLFTRRFAVAATAAAALFCAALPAARADVKIVSTVTVTGVPGTAAPKPMTVTTYYKGDKQRTESPDNITIYDCAKDQQYVLNPQTKTYYVVSVAEAMKAATANNPFLAMVKFDTSVDLKPTDQKKEIAGKQATLYNYTATIKMTMDANPEIGAMLPTITLKGEQWTTEAVTLPANCANMRSAQMLRTMRATMGNGISQIAEKLGEMKGAPLSNKVTVTMKAQAEIPGLPKDPIVTTSEVTGVSEEALSDDLFAVPADYKKVDPPAVPTPGLPGAGAPG